MFGEMSGAHTTRPTLLYDESFFSPGGGSLDISGQTKGVYVATGLSISIPSAGTYLVLYDVRGNVSISNVATVIVVAMLYIDDTGTPAAVNNSERLVTIVDTTSSTTLENTMIQKHSAFSQIVTAKSACKIYLYTKWNGSGTPIFNFVQINSDVSGRTKIGYIKIN